MLCVWGAGIHKEFIVETNVLLTDMGKAMESGAGELGKGGDTEQGDEGCRGVCREVTQYAQGTVDKKSSK